MMTKENEFSNLSKKINLKNLLDYQKGAIVSRTLIDKNSGTLTIFALDKGQSISEHSAPHDAIAHILEGKCEFTIENKKYSLEKNEAVTIESGEMHSIKAPQKLKMLLIMIN